MSGYILKVELETGLDPRDPRVAELFAPLLRRGWRLAFYRPGPRPFPEGTARPFCLAHAEREHISLTYYA